MASGLPEQCSAPGEGLPSFESIHLEADAALLVGRSRYA
jgi:hypothetical protein